MTETRRNSVLLCRIDPAQRKMFKTHESVSQAIKYSSILGMEVAHLNGFVRILTDNSQIAISVHAQ